MNLGLYSTQGFDRGAPRWKEAAWWILRALFFLGPIPWPSEIRCAILRGFGARIGSGVVIRNGVNISFPWRFLAGDHVWIGEEVMILSLAEVRLESHICISQRAFLCTGSHNHRQENFALITKPIHVENKCWIAAQAFVAPGVTLGTGSVVSAGSVVLKDVPNGKIVRGNPAVEIEPYEAPSG